MQTGHMNLEARVQGKHSKSLKQSRECQRQPSDDIVLVAGPVPCPARTLALRKKEEQSKEKKPSSMACTGFQPL